MDAILISTTGMCSNAQVMTGIDMAYKSISMCPRTWSSSGYVDAERILDTRDFIDTVISVTSDDGLCFDIIITTRGLSGSYYTSDIVVECGTRSPAAAIRDGMCSYLQRLTQV